MAWLEKLFQKPAEAPGSVDEQPHIPTAAVTTICNVYDDTGHRVEGEFDYRSGFSWIDNHPGHFVWLSLKDPNPRQMSHVGRVYNLHELLVEDCSTDHQRPKLERFDDSLALVLRTLRYVDHDEVDNPAGSVETGEIILVAGPNYFISIQHGGITSDDLDIVRRKLEADPDDLSRGPAMCMYAIADHVVDTYLEVTQLIDEDVDDLEDAVFEPGTTIDIDETYAVKREVLEIKHIITPLAGPLRQLSLGTHPLIPSEICNYFRDVEDHLLRATADIHSFDEVLSSLIEAAVAKVGVRQHLISRQLSALVAVIAGPTLIASIYGMNFEFMPTLEIRGFFYLVLGIMVLWMVTMFVLFKKKGWL